MTNQQISKNKLYEDSLNSIKIGSSYFLAGIFLIITVFQMPSTGSDINVVRWFTWLISGTFIITGTVVIVSLFPIKESFKEQIRKLESRVAPTLYTISLVQLAINEAKFYQTHSILLLSITGVFIILVLIAIIYMVVKMGVLKHIPSLMLGSLTFIMITLILMMIENNRWSVLPYGIIGVALLILAILRWDQLEKHKN